MRSRVSWASARVCMFIAVGEQQKPSLHNSRVTSSLRHHLIRGHALAETLPGWVRGRIVSWTHLVTPSFRGGQKVLTSTCCWFYREARVISPLTRICGTQHLFKKKEKIPPPPSSDFSGLASVLPAVSCWIPGCKTKGDKWEGHKIMITCYFSINLGLLCIPGHMPSNSSVCLSFNICL